MRPFHCFASVWFAAAMPEANRPTGKENSMANEPQSINRARWQAQTRDLSGFDYKAPAELYPSRSRRVRGPFSYKRFNTSAEALRFAMEQMPEGALLGATLEVNEQRFTEAEMRALYESPAFPLKRTDKNKKSAA
jgi:hypothetical protein